MCEISESMCHIVTRLLIEKQRPYIVSGGAGEWRHLWEEEEEGGWYRGGDAASIDDITSSRSSGGSVWTEYDARVSFKGTFAQVNASVCCVCWEVITRWCYTCSRRTPGSTCAPRALAELLMVMIIVLVVRSRLCSGSASQTFASRAGSGVCFRSWMIITVKYKGIWLSSFTGTRRTKPVCAWCTKPTRLVINTKY